MEHINADMGVGEKFPGDGDETVVHITAVVPDAFALLRREFTEIPLQVFRGNSGQDVDDDAGFAIGDIAVVLGDIPARLLRIPRAGAALEFIYA